MYIVIQVCVVCICTYCDQSLRAVEMERLQELEVGSHTFSLNKSMCTACHLVQYIGRMSVEE